MPDVPLIGITTYRQPANWSAWTQVPADLLPAAYARSVAEAGGVPVLIPPVASAADARAVISRIDGLIVAGGPDVNPERYHEQPDPHVATWYDDRDASELWLLDAAKERLLSVFGICRGMQIMAVQAGGTLIQHLPDAVGDVRYAGNKNEYSPVPVTVDPGHRISSLIGRSVLASCHHHQAVRTHPGFIATARSSGGVMQAMESEGERFELAVQWHPEVDADKRLFIGLVEAAQRFANR